MTVKMVVARVAKVKHQKKVQMMERNKSPHGSVS
jgi:hypothetical protein